MAYWGDFSKVKVSAGLFDGESATGDPELLTAARVQIDFWDKESGYYLNGTYYGAKNLLAIGAAIQAQDGDTATTVDFLLERKLADDGGVSRSRANTRTTTSSAATTAGTASSEGAYVLGAYLFRNPSASASSKCSASSQRRRSAKGGALADYDQDTTEFNFNYVIKEFNARLMFFVINTNFQHRVKTGDLRSSASASSSRCKGNALKPRSASHETTKQYC